MKQEYTFSVYTENQVGVLVRIAAMFSRRKINVESLNVSPSELEGIHRFTIVIVETKEILKAFCNTNEEIVWQEAALYKVDAAIICEKVKVERLLHEYGARAVAIRNDYIVFETTGHREETEGLLKALEPHGLIEFVRAGRVAIIKESKGFHQHILEFEKQYKHEMLKENKFLDKQKEVFSM